MFYVVGLVFPWLVYFTFTLRNYWRCYNQRNHRNRLNERFSVFLTLPSRTITIVHWILTTEIFQSQSFSLQATCLHPRQTEFFLNRVSLHKTDLLLTETPLHTLSCLLYRRVRSLMDALEAEFFCLREISIYVNKLLAVLLLYVFILISLFLY